MAAHPEGSMKPVYKKENKEAGGTKFLVGKERALQQGLQDGERLMGICLQLMGFEDLTCLEDPAKTLSFPIKSCSASSWCLRVVCAFLSPVIS